MVIYGMVYGIVLPTLMTLRLASIHFLVRGMLGMPLDATSLGCHWILKPELLETAGTGSGLHAKNFETFELCSKPLLVDDFRGLYH